MCKKILIFTLALTGISLQAQIDKIIINGQFNGVPVLSFFQEIEDNYPVKFYYLSDWLSDYHVTENFKNTPLNEALNKILTDKPYIYHVVRENMIILLPKEEIEVFMATNFNNTGYSENDINTRLIGDPNEAGKYKMVTLSGKVVDGKTGEPLIGATVQIKGTPHGVVTDLQGNYKIQTSPGFYTIIFSSIGFEPKEQLIKIISNGTLDIKLFEKSVNIDEVSIYARRANRNVNLNQMSLIEMDARTIQELPAITGEKDVLKGLTLMPGVKAVGEFGSGIHVRGGGDDQNLFLLNGAPLMNTSHVFGLISVINPDVVSGLTLYKGHIPASYGERASSVINIKMNEVNPEKFNTSGGIGLYNTRLMLETPLFNKKLSIRLAGRTSYSDWLLNRMNDYYLKNSSAFFYDMNGVAKLNLKNDHFTASWYTSYDQFTFASDFSYQYENILGSIKWSHIFKNEIVSTITAAYSNYDVDRDEIENIFYKSRINTGITYKSAKANFSYNGFGRHEIDWGIKAIRYDVFPGDRMPISEESLIKPVKIENEQGMEYAIYASDIFDLTTDISLNMGVRYSRFDYLGPTSVYAYENPEPSEIGITDTIKHGEKEVVTGYEGLEPRASLKVQLGRNNSLKFSYNRNLQYISLISHTSISTPEDIWKLSDPYLEPLEVNQFATGYYHNFFDNKLETYLEIYYKDLFNLHEYRNNANITLNDHIETELINANGKGYGIEFFIRKNAGRINGWISYTYSRAFVKTNGARPETSINDNLYYPSNYDKPHDLTVVLNYNLNKRVRLSTNFSYASGRPVTLPEYQYKFGRDRIVYYSDRNKYRLPPYHRLDISLTIDESLRKNKKWKGSWTFSVLNLYGRNNAYTIFYKKEDPTYVNDYRWFSMYKMYIIGRPLPAITYSFKF